MRILYVSPEVAPFAKTGGLADVAGALPAALARMGHDVKVVMPKYAAVEEKRWGLKPQGYLTARLAGKDYSFALWSANLPGTSVEVLFLGNDPFFSRSGLYQENSRDYPDNLERFAAFSRAVLEIPRRLDWYPDVLHANDWQTALTIAYLKAYFAEEAPYEKIGTAFTIHNLGYLGLFPAAEFSKLGLLPSYFTPDTLEFYGKVNLLKAGLVFSRVLNTVSSTYSREIQTPDFGHGMDGVLRARRQDLHGIVNGVDYQQWDPSHDPYIALSYDRSHLQGKRLCKLSLQKECKLPVTGAPVIGMITRLTPQKGVDLLLEVLEDVMLLELQLIILGAGDPDIQQGLKLAASRFSQKLSVHLTFDEPFAHRIEAGADLFLMPSRYEPCGLNQLYSLRYGTIPVVRKTGGLADTVTDATPSNIASGKATGFIFEGTSSHALLTTLRFALQCYKDRPLWEKMVQTAMSADFSWDRSARLYTKLYEQSVNKTREG